MQDRGGEPHAPRFSAAEMARRRGLLTEAMAAHDLSHLVLYGANRFGSSIAWLTGWPVTREAMVLVEPGETDVLLVQFYNHVPQARRVAAEADVRWGGRNTAATIAELLRARSARRVGTIGPLTVSAHETLTLVAPVVSLDRAYTEARLVKSPEEVEALRVAAALSDDAMAALQHAARAGVDEHHLVAAIEAAYLPAGGVNHVHYLAVTSMEHPDRCVPSQYPSARSLRPGDAVAAEISASQRDYAGQVLRSFAVEADPSPLYAELHRAADAAFDAIAAVLRHGATCEEVIDAATVIEDAGFTIYDDLLHGFGGGYLPPILGTRSRMLDQPPDMTFSAGMTVVVQPNVITPDERAGVQTGELLHVTQDGCERLHRFPRGFLRAPS